jgi:hypothetical protein
MNGKTLVHTRASDATRTGETIMAWVFIAAVFALGALALYLLWAKTTFEPGETNFFGMATDFISFV